MNTSPSSSENTVKSKAIESKIKVLREVLMEDRLPNSLINSHKEYLNIYKEYLDSD